jgi:hypothetical protein
VNEERSGLPGPIRLQQASAAKNNRLSAHVHDVRFFVGYANTRPTSGELAKRHPESGSLVQFDVSSGCTSTAAVAIIEAIGLRLCMACCAIIVRRN